jgi:hypothetical protein
MRTVIPMLAAAAAVLAFSADALGDVVVVPCSRDNTLFQDADGDTSSGAGTSLYSGVNSQERVRRALLRFELAGIVPAGARVDSVVLTLHVASAPDTVAHAFSLHRVVRDWGEGASTGAGGSGAPALPGDATWLHAFHPGDPWSTAGGDFVALPSATALVGDVGSWTWTGAGLVADVQAWIDAPSTLYGWLLRGDEATARSVRRFDAREAATAAFHPSLTIHYAGTLPAQDFTWGRLKAAYR